MILLEAGERSERARDALAILAGELARRGHRPLIDALALGGPLRRRQQLDLAPWVTDRATETASRVLMIAAHLLTDETLSGLRRFAARSEVPVTAVGRFATRQALIGMQSRLAYALGREPEVFDLGSLLRVPLIADELVPPVVAPPAGDTAMARPRIWLGVPHALLEDPATLPALAAFDQIAQSDLRLLVSGRGAEFVRKSRFAGLSLRSFEELPPAAISGQAEIFAVLGDCFEGQRSAQIGLQMMAAGKVVIDGTRDGNLVAAGAPALRGPETVQGILGYLLHTVLPQRAEIARRIGVSPWVSDVRLERFEKLIGLPAPVTVGARAPAATDAPGRLVFLPTNGVGLGHAQRCTAIAAALPEQQSTAFAVFPSCVGLVNAAGHPCLPLVQKSSDHADEGANDVINYLRLRRLIGPGDRLVFDGGYVFDSVYRLVQERAVPAMWIRRGLWQAGQTIGRALEREGIFARVLVPEEAFAELNTGYSFGQRVFHTGPILRDTPPPDPGLRDRLRRRYGHEVRSLVVTMLGGGVAADRTAQLMALCAQFERRPHCLHLVVLWPGATWPPGLQGWANSRLVQTLHAAELAQAADLVISAAGYNAVHECLYYRVPAILVPQMAPYMDDQERRAQAAADRGLAIAVRAGDLLRLGQEVEACLDQGRAAELRAALAAAELPEPGTREAAARIMEDWG